ncbi:MAG: hypothetical protein U9N81_05865 [Bacillota bacterium]|nr:hypothetical protein [Bacillota bacterium]
MLLRLINKDESHYLDLSTFINCSPERILFYYYNSYIRISLATYRQMQEWSMSEDTPESSLNQWLDLMRQEMGIDQDLEILQNSPFIDCLGPYYYGPTNTQLFIDKTDNSGKNPITSVDFAVLFTLHKNIKFDKDLQKYYKTRKSPKKTTPTIDIIIKDIGMCINAMGHIHRIHRQCHYLQLLIEHRNQLLAQDNIAPSAPLPRPDRPKKPSEPEMQFNSIRALGTARAKQKNYIDECNTFGHKLKIYFIQYREYEKASERYKEALKEWELYYNHLIERCLDDIEEATAKLESTKAILEIYEYILMKSYVHPDYHDTEVLTNFKYYLQTGRANDLQDCMNLYEEEQHWSDIKESQKRIENTIHFLQAEADLTGFNDQLSAKLIAATSESLQQF